MIDFKDFNENISDEMLAAYIDGNATPEEVGMIQSQLINDDSLSEVIDISSDGSNYLSYPQEDIECWNDLLGVDNGLQISIEDNIDNTILNIFQDMSTNNNIGSSGDKLRESVGAAAAMQCFGEEGNGSGPNPDLLIYQGNEGVCAIRSQQIVLRDYGIDIPLEQLREYAIQQGWYDPSDGGGTPMGCIGALLNACGVEARQQSDCSIYDIVNELAQGHRLIVGVDANELWADREGNLFVQAREYIKDLFKETPNHALIVAGVEVNPKDPSDVKVILTDPGTGDLRIEYSFDDFMDAWQDSGCFMTTTTMPAPYQYDELHARMVPSNFAVEHFVDTNSLPIQPDILAEGYVAAEYPDMSLSELNENAHYKEGHLDTVGLVDGQEVDFDTFAEAHKLASEKHLSTFSHGALGQDHFSKDAFISALKDILGHKQDADEHSLAQEGHKALNEEEASIHDYDHTYTAHGGGHDYEEGEDGDDNGDDDGDGDPASMFN